jgi:hypothetical protein
MLNVSDPSEEFQLDLLHTILARINLEGRENSNAVCAFEGALFDSERRALNKAFRITLSLPPFL